MKQKILIGLTVGLLAACGQNDNGETIATVGDKEITSNEFKHYLQFKRVPQQDEKKVEAMLDDYLQREALAQLVQESDYIDQGLAMMEVNEFRKQMLISRYFENYLKDKVSEAALLNYYSSNADQFQTERVHVAHILLRTNPAMTEKERQVLLTKAQEAYSKLQASEEFETIVTNYSEDTISAKNAGDLGWIKKGAIDPVFSKKIFAMQAGDISEPFLTTFGYHIVKLIEGPQVEKAPFEKVKGDIRYQLRQQTKEAEMRRLLGASQIEKVKTDG